jgi:prepilin-type N-terminal cleavage/methylation domain-containing protein
MSRGRDGMTLLEVMVAMSILAGSVISAGAYFTRFTRTVVDERTRSTALSLVNDRVEQIKTAPTYGGIDSIYAGIESSISGYAGYTRKTDVKRVGGTAADSIDYKIVTITVTTPAIPKSITVSKSTIFSDF